MVHRQAISDEVWNDNYRAPGESCLEDTWERQAKACSLVEDLSIRDSVYKDFLWLLSDFKGIAGGRITANLGVSGRESTSLMNCFVHNPADIKFKDPDSLSGIYDMLKAQALTLKSEGGYGMNFSWIRPAGSYVSGIGGRTPGVLKFMELWDKSSEVITMGYEKTIDRKNDEKKKIRKGAQMGVLACVSGSSLISTIDGKIAIKDLVGKNPYLYCTDCNGNVFVRQASKIWSNGIKKVIKISFDNDDHIICTPDHKILLSNGSYKEAGSLSFGDSISSLRKRVYKKYLQLGVTGYKKYISEHFAVAELKYGRYPIVKMENGGFSLDSEEVHHIDFNTVNNSIDNLELINRHEHAIKHGNSDDFILRKYQKSLAEARKGVSDNDWYGVEKSKSIQLKRIASRKSNGTNTAWNKGLASDEYKSHYKSGFKNQFDSKLADETNHKVIKVEDFGEEEVFDISVPDFHNFVANGIFVHNCWHPEIENFIVAKQTEGRLAKFNISVGIYKGFMEAVESDQDWPLIFPDTSVPEYKEIWAGDIDDWKSRNLPVKTYKVVKARDLWEMIMKSTYNRNDPGILFLDVANLYNPLYYAENVVTTNPCGEINMSTGVCLLFSLNLVKYIKKTDAGFEFDFETFKKASAISVRFADNINDISRVPIEDYKKSMTEKRRIGIGVVGLGSLLVILGLRYGSKEALDLTEQIFKTKAETEILASALLGKEKGSFPLFDKDKYFSSHWWKTLPISNSVKNIIEKIGCMRNSHRSANAPTGNMSIYAGVLAGGIEPLFNLEYARWSIVPEGERAILRSIGFNFPDVFCGEWFETEHLKKTKAGTDDILIGEFNGIQYQVDKNRGLTKKTIVEDWSWLFIKENFDTKEIERRKISGLLATAGELSHKEHIDMLKIIAKYIDMNSSKTINLPNDYPYESFKNIYMDAWKSGIKGVTTYRAGTMAAVLEDTNVERKKDREAPKRPKELPCNIHTAKIDGNKWAVIIGLFEGNPYEVFAGPIGNLDIKNNQNGFVVKSKRGEYNLVIDGDVISTNNTTNIVDMFGDNASAWATRLVSMSLRHNVPIRFIYDQLSKDGFITDINKVLARILKKYITEKKTDLICPECGSSNVKIDPCFTCIDCNYGKCS